MKIDYLQEAEQFAINHPTFLDSYGHGWVQGIRAFAEHLSQLEESKPECQHDWEISGRSPVIRYDTCKICGNIAGMIIPAHKHPIENLEFGCDVITKINEIIDLLNS